ncbi:hypothetical protein V1512DRAFT_5313 [Lipomyces arxii]|uniref:uncharacterized protein n=1 Tax=Lipomyces arxii TaxID=56418 RepID=UPI0034CD3055
MSSTADYENGSRESYDQSYDDRRSASPVQDERPAEVDYRLEEAANPGDNLFVTGLSVRVSEDMLRDVFAKYGEVEKCEIMKDPHSRESRGFGFVKFVDAGEADAAREGLQGFELEGKLLSVQVAKRNRPRSPTPGKYFGPRRRENNSGGMRRRPRYDDRYRGDDRGDRYRDEYRDRDRYYDRDRDRGDRYRDSRDDRYREPYRERERGDRYMDRDRGERYSSSRYDDRYDRR